jgi:ferredoxin
VRVRAHPGLCLGYGNCHRFAPAVYTLDENDQIDIHLLDVPEELALDAWIGASVCPERAITVIGPPEAYWVTRRDARRVGGEPTGLR